MSQQQATQLPEYKPIFKPVESEIYVETEMMQAFMGQTMAAHGRSPLAVWYGETRIGKTITARLLTQKINDAFAPDNPDAFRAAHYQVGEIKEGSGNEMKKAIKSLYEGVLKFPLDKGTYMHDSPEGLARRFVVGMLKKNIRMAFVDEIQQWSLDAMRALVLVANLADDEKWPLTIVCVGMADFPIKIQQDPRIEGRVQCWCYFTEYDLENTWNILAKLHPYFEGLDKNNSVHQEQVKFIHKEYGGFFGQLVPFIHRFEYRLRKYQEEVDMVFLRVVHQSLVNDKTLTMEHSVKVYGGSPAPKAAAKRSGKASPKQSKTK